MTDTNTSSKILDAAETLFANQGFHATTLRQITRTAGVNLAAVHYHLGSKQALVHAVFERYLDDLNRQRLRQLENAVTEASGRRLERILEALVEPALLLGGQDDRNFARLLVRAFAENDRDLHRFVRDRYSHVMKRFAAAISEALEQAGEKKPDDAELRRQLDFIVGALTYAMTYDAGDGNPTQVAASLVRFAATALRGTHGSPALTPEPAEA